MPVNPPNLSQLRQDIAYHLDMISGYFKPGNKVTLVVRQPDQPGDTGLVMSDDDLDAAIAEIRKRQAETTGGHQ